MSAPNSQDSDDELEDCPICVEPFDESDRMFLPCHCNYKVCMFCVRRLMTEFDGRCPGCRSVYSEANFRIREIDPEEVERRKLKEKLRNQERLRQQQQSKQQQQQTQVANQLPAGKNTAASGTAAAAASRVGALGVGQHQAKKGGATSGGPQGPEQENALAQQRKNLANVRVVQNHVVFVLGLPISLAKEDILRRPEHFGQYGPIQKIVVGHPASAPGRAASASAHITFARAEDAREAIRGVDGVVVDGHQIRASFGTTRYCHAFLRGQQCPNPDCLFLHQEVDPSTQTMNRPPANTAGSPGVFPQQLNHQQQLIHQQSRAQQRPGGAALASGAFGGTDPFALENVPEPLNGIEIAQYEKTRPRPAGVAAGSLPLPQVQGSRAPGHGRPLPSPSGSISATSSPLGGPASAASLLNQPNHHHHGVQSQQQPISYDCALSHVADLVMSRATMSDDLKKKFSWVTGPRLQSNQFSGLECVLSSSAPLFIAPTVSNLENTDPSLLSHRQQGSDNNNSSSGDSNNGGGRTGNNNPRAGGAQQQDKSDKGKDNNSAAAAAAADLTSKDKKLTRKNKKAAFAAQNRIGGEDAY